MANLRELLAQVESGLNEKKKCNKINYLVNLLSKLF